MWTDVSGVIPHSARNSAEIFYRSKERNPLLNDFTAPSLNNIHTASAISTAVLFMTLFKSKERRKDSKRLRNIPNSAFRIPHYYEAAV